MFIQLENPDIAHPYHLHHQTRRLLKASTSMLTEWIEKRFVEINSVNIISLHGNIFSNIFVAGTMSMALLRNFPNCQRKDITTPVLLFLPPG